VRHGPLRRHHPKRGFFPARTLILIGTLALPIALVVGVGATAATAVGRNAHGVASSRSGVKTSATEAPPGAVTLTSTGGEQTYTVPSGVVLLSVDAIGAGGGGTSPGDGYGLTVQLPVTPNETLYAEVGVPGTDGGLTGFGGGGAAGKTTSGPTTSDAGSGGGATDVRTCSEEATSCAGGGTSAASRLIVAGGGGGGGGQGSSVSDVCGFSQSGGNAGTGNGSGGTVETTTAGTVILGSPDATEAPSTPAGGGSTAPGAGGPSATNCGTGGTSDTSSAAGSAAVGGAGGGAGTGVSGTGGGGGGGGGYFGGGGGASGPEGCIAGACDTFFDGEGGGGGSSFVTAAAQLEPGSYANSSSAPSVTFTPQIEIDAPVDGARYMEGQVVNAAWECNGSQISGCTGTTASGQPIGTTTCGANTYAVTGTIMGQMVTGTSEYTVTLNVTTSSLDGATTGIAYRDQLEAACGVSPYKWRITSGALPKGLKLRTSGVIAGVPYKKDTPGPYSFAVVVKDAATPHDIATAVLTLDLASK
jgi:hypothetical protein